ncbi:MAG: hypothetical protein FP827_02175 [Candidatus Omnitrophica bacterium]|nr:hypothetical protein [Candidatus Omnitrophota bacterium]
MKKILLGLFLSVAILSAWSDSFYQPVYNDTTTPTTVDYHVAGRFFIGPSTYTYGVAISSWQIRLQDGTIITSTAAFAGADNLTSEIARATARENDIAVSTGNIQTDLDIAEARLVSVGVDTGTIKAALNAEITDTDTNFGNVAIDTTTLGTDLTTEISDRQTGDSDLGYSTGVISGQIDSLQTQISNNDDAIEALGVSTGTIYAALQSTGAALSAEITRATDRENDIAVGTGTNKTAIDLNTSGVADLRVSTGTNYAAINSTAAALTAEIARAVARENNIAYSTGTTYAALQATFTYLNEYKLGVTAKAADSELLAGRNYDAFVSTMGDTMSGDLIIEGYANPMSNRKSLMLKDKYSGFGGTITVDSEGLKVISSGQLILYGEDTAGLYITSDGCVFLKNVEFDPNLTLSMNEGKITNISTSPVNNGDASTKGYTDYAIMKATDAIGGGSGDMTKAVYDTDANNVVDNVQKRYVYFSKVGELSSFTGDSWGSDFRLLPDTYTLTKAYIMQGSTGTTDTIIHVGNQDNLEIAAFTIPVGADCVELSTSVVFNKCDIINYHIDDIATPTNLMVWNAGFEDSQTGVAGSSWTELGTAASIGRQSDFAHKGTYSCRFDNLTTSYSGRWIAYSTVTITATETYTVSAWFRTNYATTTNIRLYIDLFDAGNNLVGTVTSGATNLTSDSTWGGISISTTAASNVTQGRLNIDANESINNDAEVWIDQCLVGINIPAISNLAITLELEKQ